MFKSGDFTSSAASTPATSLRCELTEHLLLEGLAAIYGLMRVVRRIVRAIGADFRSLTCDELQLASC